MAWLILAASLACPVAMGVMMLAMRRGARGPAPPDRREGGERGEG